RVLRLGVVMSVPNNSAGKGEISGRPALCKLFLDRYFAYTPPDIPKPSSAEADARAVSGHYLTSRRSESNFLKAANPFEEARVIPDEDGAIKVIPLKDFNGESKRWREIGPMVY